MILPFILSYSSKRTPTIAIFFLKKRRRRKKTLMNSPSFIVIALKKTMETKHE
jgi:hypothetical protein